MSELTRIKEAYARLERIHVELEEIMRMTNNLLNDLQLALKLINEYEEKLKQVKQ